MTTHQQTPIPTQAGNLSFGLTAENIEFRKGSIGASDARIIVNGDDEQVEALWQIKRGELAPLDLSRNIHCQFGQYVEAFHCNWFEMRTGQNVTRVQEEATHPSYPGMHVTLDGFLTAMPPVEFANPDGEFRFSWGCNKPAGPVSGPIEFKWRDPFQFKLEDQVRNFLPQCHQAMALTGSSHAVLSTLTGSLGVYAHVVEFDPFYWAECMARIEDFAGAVKSGRRPRKFPAITAPAGMLTLVKTQLRTVDMAKGPKANLWAAWAQMMLSTSPNEAESVKIKGHEKAKDQLKTMIDKDTGIAHGFGITAKRDARGAIRFTMDEDKAADARARWAEAARETA